MRTIKVETYHPNPINVNKAGELFNARVVGTYASLMEHAMNEHGYKPTERDWKLILGDEDITVEEMGRMAYFAGMSIDIVTSESKFSPLIR
jgi:hypothetical protein